MKKILLLCVWLFALPAAAAEVEQAPITVFAAASLTNALQELGDAFTKETSIPVRFSFAASSALARQIENGAPADVFFSADLEWMDYLQSRNLIQRDTRRDILGNRLVLWIARLRQPYQAQDRTAFRAGDDVGQGPPGDRGPRFGARRPLCARSVDHARCVETTWRRAWCGRDKRAPGVLAFVDRGEAQLGIVYETDALIDKQVRVVDVFPADSHLPIIYPIALTRAAKADAARFLREYILRARGAVGIQVLRLRATALRLLAAVTQAPDVCRHRRHLVGAQCGTSLGRHWAAVLLRLYHALGNGFGEAGDAPIAP